MSVERRENLPELDYGVIGVLSVLGLGMIVSREPVLIVGGVTLLFLATLHYRWIRRQLYNKPR